MAADIQPRLCKLSKKEGESFGFFLRIEKDIEGHLIRSVAKGGPADNVGLRDGDRVIRVNADFVDSKEHHQVVDLIKMSGNSVNLQVLDDASYTKAKKQGVNMSQLSGTTATLLQPVMNGVSGKTPQPKLCYLVKQASSFGFSLKTIQGISGLFMTEISPTGAAFNAGVQTNDRIVELNGENVENINHQQMVVKMKGLGDSIILLLIDEVADKYFKSKMTKVVATMASVKGLPYKPRIVHLTKGPQGYGFYLRVEQGREGHLIREIDADSPAEKAGLLDGDLLIAVNGNVVQNLHHEELVEKIRNCGNKTTFLVVDQQTNELYKKAGISPIRYWEEVYESHQPMEDEKSRESQKSVDRPQHGPKVCHLTKGPDGYGFTLNPIKDVRGQRIKEVVKGSAAEEAGLEMNDILIEVNGVNVESDTHEELVERMKNSTVKLNMLVIGQENYDHFKRTSSPTSPAVIPEPTTEPASAAENIKEESTPKEPVTQEPVAASLTLERREQAETSSSSSADEDTDGDTQM